MPRDATVVAQTSLEVVPTGPLRERDPGPLVERTVRRPVVASDTREAALDLAHELRRRFERRVRANQHRVVPHPEQAPELRRGVRMIIHPKVDVAVIPPLVAAMVPNDQQRRGLPP